MTISKILWSFFFCTIVFMFVGFQSKDAEPEAKSIEELIKMNVDKRVNEFTKRSLGRCQEKVMKRANEIVDSILIANAQVGSIIDSIQKPPKPTKPEKPIVPVVNDNTPIEPLLPNGNLERDFN